MLESWTASGIGNWFNDNWSPFISGPTPTDDAFIGTGSGGTVDLTSGTATTVNSIGVSTNYTFVIENESNLIATAGTGAQAITGTITVDDGSGFTVGGNVDNSGTIELESAGNGATFSIVQTPNLVVVLSGGGNIAMDGVLGANNFIQGASGSELINGNNDISGTGTIEGGFFVNHGTIETNNGFGAGTLKILGTGFSSGSSFDNEGTMLVDPGGTTVLGIGNSQIVNDGTIQLLGTGSSAATLAIEGNLTLLSFGGTIEMQGSDPAKDAITSTVGSASLTLDGGTLEGAGVVGDVNLTINLGAGALVNANGGGTLAFESGSTVTIASGAEMEATPGGILLLTDNVANNGTIAANGGIVSVDANIASTNGTFSIGRGGELNAVGGVITGNVTFTGVAATLFFASSASQLNGDIVGAQVGDGIDLNFQDFAPGDHCVWQQNGGTGTLTLETGGSATLATLTLVGQYTSGDFTVLSDPSGQGTLIKLFEGAHDFNADGYEDVLLQSSGGNVVYANMAGGAFQNFVNVGNVPGWNVVGSGDIAGTADADIVLQNQSSGQIIYANMAGGALSGYVNVGTMAGSSVVGVGDIMDNGFDSIVVENSTSGQIAYANMTGDTFQGWVNVATTPGWTVDAVGDILGNGYADIIAENASGAIIYANMTGGTFQGWAGVTGTPGWNVVGAGDVKGNGYDDIVIQNQSTGQIAYADMTGGTFNGFVNIATTPGWNVTAVEDVMGNGYDDIVIQNSSTGQIAYANMTGGVFNNWVGVGSTPVFTGHTGPAAAGSTVAATVMFDPGPVSTPTTQSTPNTPLLSGILHA